MGEDIAALAGLTLALAAIGLSLLTGNPAFDAWGSIAVGALLLLVAVGVGAQVQSLLIGESAAPETRQALTDWLQSRPEIAELYNLITFQLGSDQFVAVKAKMREERSAVVLVDQVNAVQDALKAAFPAVRWVFFEPDRR
jgi:divalent metal cation (Fe/Co/Zn/Cd) transporter